MRYHVIVKWLDNSYTYMWFVSKKLQKEAVKSYRSYKGVKVKSLVF